MEEEWRQLRKCPDYEVSNLGRIRRITYAAYQLNRVGYPRANLFIEGRRTTVLVHRAVAEAFIPNPENLPQVDHKDGNRANYSLENLEWVTSSENCLRASKRNQSWHPTGEQHWKSKLNADEVREIRSLKGNSSHKEIAKKFGVSKSTIRHILHGRTWTEV